jgi:ribosome-associated protein
MSSGRHNGVQEAKGAAVKQSNVRPEQQQVQPSALELTQIIIEACSEAKGGDMSVLDVSANLDLASYFIIVSGRSDRQVQGICNRVMHALEERKIRLAGIEGYERAHWVLLDCQDVILHVFYEPTRALYRLEDLWDSAKKLDVSIDAAGKPILLAA